MWAAASAPRSRATRKRSCSDSSPSWSAAREVA
jgi:hypothetical protein